MRNKLISAACLAMASPVLIGALAGCGRHASAAAGRPLASQTPASQTPASRPPTAPTRLASRASTSPAAGRSPAAPSESAAPSPSATSRNQGSSPLADGLYADAPASAPHYVFALAHSRPEAIHGSVTFFYQDGRADTIGTYTGRLSEDGRLTLVFSSGGQLTGTYRSGHLSLTNCASVLRWASQPGYCQFAYGNAP
jgi:hypothetical protein